MQKLQNLFGKIDMTNKAIILALFIFTLLFSSSLLNPTSQVMAGKYVAIRVDPSSIDGSTKNDHTSHSCQGTTTLFRDIIPATDANKDGFVNDNDCYCLATGGKDTTYCRKKSSSSSSSSKTSSSSSSKSSSSSSNNTPSSSSSSSSSSTKSSSSSSNNTPSSSSSSSSSSTKSSSSSSASSSSISTNSSVTSSSSSSSSNTSSSSATVIDNSGVGGVQDYNPQAYVAPKRLIKTGGENLLLEILNLVGLNK